ncbi:glycerate dehydrogenase [Paraliobacillus quinghaiensis]|uniref:Glycerate dehydrogenase n=1 Tax=Paraliobacillus quinghaiensis TaxID=470815 RepID=A0A917WT54_9BACI|nr:D-2-hydroxyacid dehydrogenase [Paraliobacillus quinghaiensis]GGM29702.1 glycerate dehydrogenase [Paraliobacillus quinghaiensis]
MFVLATTTLTKESREYLIRQYPAVEFQFLEDVDQAGARLSEADILLTFGSDLTVAHIKRAKKLKWIMLLSAGMDEMPLQAIKENGIKLTNVRAIHQIPMAEYAISMLLNAYRQNDTLWRNQYAREWDSSLEIKEISNRTMTIVGAGAIGEELARLAKAFRMKTIGVSRSGKPSDNFDQMYQTNEILKGLKEADFVVSILPSTEETLYIYKQEHFKEMKDSAVFLNMGRGDVVQSETLIMALDQNQISHAILDVFEQEPLPKTHPLWQHPKVTMTPHISGVSLHYIPRALELFEKNLKTYLKDGSLVVNLIDLKRGY